MSCRTAEQSDNWHERKEQKQAKNVNGKMPMLSRSRVKNGSEYSPQIQYSNSTTAIATLITRNIRL